jgi:hypothetical protein
VIKIDYVHTKVDQDGTHGGDEMCPHVIKCSTFEKRRKRNIIQNEKAKV